MGQKSNILQEEEAEDDGSDLDKFYLLKHPIDSPKFEAKLRASQKVVDEAQQTINNQ
eukprot:JP444751.1.p2 GENE.JP444751.1~~JP444751.1.p2  ORF type:complete len:57 (-),score=21.02 JP444751.1:63-233(-)